MNESRPRMILVTPYFNVQSRSGTLKISTGILCSFSAGMCVQ